MCFFTSLTVKPLIMINENRKAGVSLSIINIFIIFMVVFSLWELLFSPPEIISNIPS